MPATDHSLLVAVADPVVFVKVRGRACFKLSVPFKGLLAAMRQRGYSEFVLDLSECVIMDSTFSGVLAGAGAKWAAEKEPKMRGRICLFQPNDRIRDLLDNLGVGPLFQRLEQPPVPTHAYQTPATSEATPSKLELSKTCLEAHLTLMNLNPENVSRFKDVAKFLAEDIDRLQGGASKS
jgi:anti-anti-sigma regulatory factor